MTTLPDVPLAQLSVQLVGKMEFIPPRDVPWEPIDADGGPALVEFAGRACYQSWSRPNPKTATNAGYIDHILEVGHGSVLEHGIASFYITGVSRSLTHELIRHRHLSPSQLSQRYVPSGGAAFVEPQPIAEAPALHADFLGGCREAVALYERLLAGLEERYAGERNRTKRLKKARQAARAVLPNATETKLVMTGNFRTWRHFIDMRATEAADDEIRVLALGVLVQLQEAFPAVFRDYQVIALPDGTLIAESPYSTAGQ